VVPKNESGHFSCKPYKTGNIYAPFTGQAGKEAVNGKPKKQKKE
jgi:hypothetical protein